MCLYKADKRVEYDVLKRAALARGYSEDVLEDMLINYENLNVIMRVDNWITIVDQGWYLLCLIISCTILYLFDSWNISWKLLLKIKMSIYSGFATRQQ
mgnify:CR=1 FL=1